ncbi:MAG: MarR family winged helix-turn-helix transcriptional regulator [Floccifex sp.]
MDYTKHTINELLVGMFNYILYIEERNLKKKNIKLSMSEVHLLESIEKASDNTMSHIARRSMITQGTLTTNVKTLVAKGYVERYKDQKDGRVVRLKITDKAKEVLKVHDDFHETMIDKAISDLKLDDNKVLIDSLKNILDYFSEQYGKD